MRATAEKKLKRRLVIVRRIIMIRITKIQR